MHYYQLHIGDWIKGTSHLTLEEESIYHRLLMVYYEKERPFPDNLSMIARLIRAREHEDIIEIILNEFFKKKNKKWYHKRAEEELKKYKEKSEKARKSANARYNKKLKPCERSANAKQTHSEGSANHKPITNNHKPITNIESAVAQLPCTSGDIYYIQQSEIDTWTKAYPAVDVIQEIRKIYAWLQANPSKLKTLKGCSRFVNNWLSRTQNQGGNRKQPQQPNNSTQTQDFVELHTSTEWADGLRE